MALLIPTNFKFMGKDQQQLYKEAMSRKEATTPQPVNPVSTQKSFGKVVRLIGSNGRKEFNVMEALIEAKRQGKILASLKDADAYVIQNGGLFWTGDLIAYAAPNQKLEAELNYKDDNFVSYKMQIPNQFKDLSGKTALILPYGTDPQNPNYEFIQDADKLWTVNIINPDLIIQTKINRQNGYYKTDAGKFPNGANLPAGGTADDTYRYFLSVGNGSYLGLLRRGDIFGINGRRDVYAFDQPSNRFGVLVRG